jgi:hypothetical protein
MMIKRIANYIRAYEEHTCSGPIMGWESYLNGIKSGKIHGYWITNHRVITFLLWFVTIVVTIFIAVVVRRSMDHGPI